MPATIATIGEVLKARSHSWRTISERLLINEEDLLNQIRAGAPSGLLGRMADELAVPAFVLQMERLALPDTPLPDFRRRAGQASNLSKSTLKIIDGARRLQALAADSGHSCRRFPSVTRVGLREAQFANRLRTELGISVDEQLEAPDFRVFYATVRRKIEDRGILVIHQSYEPKDGSGFCLAHESCQVIIINTKNQSAARRVFTIVHELGHVILGKSAISDPFDVDGNVNPYEAACNSFASYFLLPAQLVRQSFERFGSPRRPDFSIIAALSQRLKVSQQAVALRLSHLRLVEGAYYDHWVRQHERLGNPDLVSVSGPMRRLPDERMKLAKFGFAFARIFSRAISEEKISEVDLYRASGLKPQLQVPYFRHARTASAADADYVE